MYTIAKLQGGSRYEPSRNRNNSRDSVRPLLGFPGWCRDREESKNNLASMVGTR